MSGAVSLTLSALDARVLRATDPLRERTVERVAVLAGCSDLDRSSPRRGSRIPLHSLAFRAVWGVRVVSTDRP
jgi:hypothetical protein